MTTLTLPTASTLNDLTEFYVPFEVHEDGSLSQPVPDTYTPDCHHDDEFDMTIDEVPYREHTEWEAFSVGYTGQYGYNGPVMHASEYLGGGLARDVLETPGVYVLVPVECHPEWREASYQEVEWWQAGYWSPDEARETEDGLEVYDTDPEPAGWTLLKKREV